MENNKPLRIMEAARLLGVHPQTLRRWEKIGLIKPKRIGIRKERRFSVEELKGLLQK